MELRSTAAPRAEGYSNVGFQNEENFLENENTSGNNSIRSRAVQSREHTNTKQRIKGHIGYDRRQVLRFDIILLRAHSNCSTSIYFLPHQLLYHWLQEPGLLFETLLETGDRMKNRSQLSRILQETENTWRMMMRRCNKKGYLVMVISACVLNFHRALPLFVITVAAIFFVVWDHLMAKYEHRIDEMLSPGRRLLNSHWFWLKWVIWSSLVLAVIFWLAFDTAKLGQQQLVSFGGLIMYIVLLFLFSKYPTRVYWRPVLWGIGLQFLLGLLILRTDPGFIAFDWLGRQVQTFLEYTDAGASFVFGEKYKDHFFAFKVLPIVVFFSTVMSMLYYLGLMQWIIRKVGWIMLVTTGSSPIESVVASGNIFVGQTESPLLVRPYLPYITKSELHAIMTAGFSTIAGSVLGAYISFGVPSSHLLTASVMSAPASLAAAKLFWPETEKPKITLKNAMKMESGSCNTGSILLHLPGGQHRCESDCLPGPAVFYEFSPVLVWKHV
ncbi:solute carrier family 28 member 3 isoform X3 [Homo sapiens]|uniref:solute carrier family 28 member 3 isoform X3 n=1 Tax=Homo sapiens TaxID=9606 RepID=UPI001FB06206|nr:solute carrier family 28 member 3 isoform X3 [Homo sapiens]